jgi:hypothetical protein
MDSGVGRQIVGRGMRVICPVTDLSTFSRLGKVME